MNSRSEKVTVFVDAETIEEMLPAPKDFMMNWENAAWNQVQRFLCQVMFLFSGEEFFVLMNREKYFAVQDYSAAIENMLLAIVELGYQSCWYEGHITDEDKLGYQI